jgi:hypothetical protein
MLCLLIKIDLNVVSAEKEKIFDSTGDYPFNSKPLSSTNLIETTVSKIGSKRVRKGKEVAS